MTARRWMSEVLHAVVFAVVIYALLIPVENVIIVRFALTIVVVGSWYAGRHRMEWLGLG